MRLGLGCTALARGRLSGHVDGIGVYTSELLKYVNSSAGLTNADHGVNNQVLCTVFGKKYGAALPTACTLPMVYSAAAATSAAIGLPFLGAASLERQIDLFHATDHYIPKLRNTPVVATIMDVIGIRHPEWVNPSLRSFKNALFRKTVGWADQIITISNYSAADIADWLGTQAPKITAIPLGVSEDYFKPIAQEDKNSVLNQYQLRPGYFISVGTLQPRKNVERIIQAHALLPSSVRTEHPLVVVGQNGWRTDDLIQSLSQLEQDGYGRWLKYVPRKDIFALLKSAHALVFPSLYEGFGLPVLEGFASGIPVITSNTSSLPEVAGEAASLVNPNSVEEIAHAMLQLVEQTDLRNTLIQKGSLQVNKFSWAETARLTSDVYREMLS
ncbi:MAG TPA: glycosyltransferase family 1 protein [Burkholderiaceae bacterium]|nr:glycosyltransferase family 1 protein [Burkholderiaceae bacterium]